MLVWRCCSRLAILAFVSAQSGEEMLGHILPEEPWSSDQASSWELQFAKALVRHSTKRTAFCPDSLRTLTPGCRPPESCC